MKVSGYTYVRNGLQYDYPFREAIRSIINICDEFIVVVGDSTDGTREAIEAMNDPRIKIVDSVWDNKNMGGRRYALQANIGLDHVSGDWAFHIQADEVVHEQDLPILLTAMKKYLNEPRVEGFLLQFINFFGDYRHWGPSRRYHQHEIRITRNDPHVRSYRDSQGFRIFNNPANQWNEKGRKLNVIPLNTRVFHYSYARNPYLQRKRQIEFEKGYHDEKIVDERFAAIKDDAYDYRNIDYLKKFKGSHPSVMHPRIARQDWEFNYDPSINNMTIKEKFMKWLEDLTGKQFFIYRNYKAIKK
ncbi:MAG: glycosyltransferase [Flavitalea sp.]